LQLVRTFLSPSVIVFQQTGQSKSGESSSICIVPFGFDGIRGGIIAATVSNKTFILFTLTEIYFSFSESIFPNIERKFREKN
jgi:hypothetical protein